jgi:hypothetical protein
MVDNTNIVVQCGSGKNAVISEEMASFARHFGFIFVAHRIGDANRSARVERSLWYIEENFYPGRQFTSLPDLNSQLRQWCETVNHRYREKLKAKPVELYQAEKAHLKPLPIYIPEVYELLPRIVDTEGYVNLHANRYSVPYELIGRKVEVKEGLNQIVVLKDNEVVATHPKKDGGGRFRVTLPEHRPKRDNSSQEKERPLSPEEQALRTHPGLASFLDQAFHHTGKSALFIRRLYQFYLDYPTESVEKVLQIACNFGLYDLGRIERMILRSIAGDYFRLQEFYHPIQKGEDTDESEIKGTPTEREPEPTADPAETHEDSGNSGGGT